MTNTKTYVSNPIPAQAGIGLRSAHYADILDNINHISWVEIHPENYFSKGGPSHQILDKVRQQIPVSFHGVGMSLGSVDEISPEYLKQLSQLIKRYEPALVSDHISWSSFNGQYFNDLLPLPYNKETLNHLTQRINHVQSILNRQILVENASTYLQFIEDDYSEPDFLNSLAKNTGCGLLLDVNNIFVNSKNHLFDPYTFLQKIDFTAVQEIHLAGHLCKNVDGEEIRIDTHNDIICDEVWDLYKYTLELSQKAIATLIEWDTDLPPIDTLLQEANKADQIIRQTTHHIEDINETPKRIASRI